MKNTESLLKDEHFKLLSFLITSARGCVNEPVLYGPLRLVDAAARLIDIMKKEGKVTPEIEELQKLIEEKKDLVMYDEEGFINFLDELSKRLGEIIKKVD
ncbi:DUF6092 family protein [Thermococcus sibiricus]|uniref:Uncharacterized protein n=1 Tax=Thermococcus sibiricus TaxID=172049 RepID=A0A117L1F4_9EURY|nr:DUF6092 family protein [Thermococcus sibiricus]KUK17168.1 MAG: Uncharacterized protein XD54_1541 [Thermococcus sibiricus]KUK27824.1 MAG: Uncharacterized protein XD61_1631 [Thermococcus sp. 40_45]